MIRVENLRKKFGDTEVIKGISAEFYPGKVNLIIGKSGSGKTVFMKSLLGLFDIDGGEIYYSGEPLSQMDFKRRKALRTEMGMVFQGSALFDSLTVEENVIFPLKMFSVMSPKEMLDRVNFCLKRVNLENSNKKYPAELSGGMKKRVAIARAIAMNPKYLFCDEPNSGLDPQTSIVIDNLIREITQEFGITTVINTHDMNSVMEIGDNIILIKEGYKAWQGSKSEILSTDNEDVNEFVFTSQLFKRIKQSHQTASARE
ncbi:phosphonate ABC transporter ATP-binding protein [Thermaurantimonas aggregans]|uniref:Phosphonate ABC transporter ATP-binding protein n=1 Tax=Thermaurantimonas aggregans TaxID=2173829 RepID=A0A401XMY0_9FLAO|nr:ATP-binding cassette domain-containing protein [Thermaurantimonas aggregans]MCX8148130.1 ATP-binding cassette domain-containing protein [Thermaurantimonas aggregans]GCD78356.1 phosphonate ABC transporter ATP-binding protein [Thermaurantimonas aggregans]